MEKISFHPGGLWRTDVVLVTVWDEQKTSFQVWATLDIIQNWKKTFLNFKQVWSSSVEARMLTGYSENQAGYLSKIFKEESKSFHQTR